MSQINEFFEEFKKIQKKSLKHDRNLASKFNPLLLFANINDENTHSDILAWLFDPFASHSQQDLFFKAFVNHFDYDIFYDSLEYKVIREFSGLESIVDILVYGKSFVLFIENKTLSLEGEDQTNREYRDLKRLAESFGIADNYHAVFLSPYGQTPQNKNFKSISYQQISSALKNIRDEIGSEYVRFFVDSWIDISSEIGRQ